MGLVSELGYELRPQNGLHRLMITLASTRFMSQLNRRTLGPTDRLISRLTKGKATFTSWGTGTPPLWLTAIGARSGVPRTVPLLGIPVGDDVAVLGTSFGQGGTPAWVHNLEANPKAKVTFRDTEIEVTARPAESAEAELVWERAIQVYPGYANYTDWASHRRIRVFILETAADTGGD